MYFDHMRHNNNCHEYSIFNIAINMTRVATCMIQNIGLKGFSILPVYPYLKLKVNSEVYNIIVYRLYLRTGFNCVV